METNFAVSKPTTREMRNLLFAVWPLQLQQCIKPSILLPYMVQRDLKKWWTYGLTKNWVIFYIFASFVLDIEMPLQNRHQEPTRYKGQLISECPKKFFLDLFTYQNGVQMGQVYKSSMKWCQTSFVMVIFPLWKYQK